MSNECTISLIKRETTEDGDLCLTFKVTAPNFDAARQFAKENPYKGRMWNGHGDGSYTSHFNKTVDGAEVAIEARNDEWASRQQEIEDHGRMAMGFF